MSQHTRDARFHVRLGWWLTLVGFGGFMAWASLAPLDQGVPVQGTVVVSGKRKAVQSMGAGVVSRILVSEGQLVRQGEPLFRLDRTQVAGRRRCAAGPVPHDPRRLGALAE